MAPEQPAFLSLYILAGERLVLILPYKHLNVKPIDIKRFQAPGICVLLGYGSQGRLFGYGLKSGSMVRASRPDSVEFGVYLFSPSQFTYNGAIDHTHSS